MTPDPPAPSLICPRCDSPLTYVKTIVSGVAPVERWDFYQCGLCLTAYDYRQRTRRLRVAASV